MRLERADREAKALAEKEKRNKPKATIIQTIEKGFWGHLKAGDLAGFVAKRAQTPKVSKQIQMPTESDNFPGTSKNSIKPKNVPSQGTMTPGGQLSRKTTLKFDLEEDKVKKVDSTDSLRKKLRKKMHAKISTIKRNQAQMKSSFQDVFAFEKLASSDPNDR
jgi:hypothetical protein